MTLKQFQDMAGLITRKEFKRVTGLDDVALRALVAAGAIRVFKRPGEPRKAMSNEQRAMSGKKGKSEKAGRVRGVYARYYTVEAARLCGFDLTK